MRRERRKMKLWNKYKGQDWFESANSYCFQRFKAVEDRLFTATRFVEIHTKNRTTFSYEFASILRDCGSIFGSTLDGFVRGSGQSNAKETNLGHYRDFLLSEIPDIHTHSLQIRPCFPGGLIVPFDGFASSKGAPAWWDAYNQVKHNEHMDFEVGNLEYALTALSALTLIGFYGSWFVSDPLFVNVGFPLQNSGYGSERLLFPLMDSA
jgi:hypothetical protein